MAYAPPPVGDGSPWGRQEEEMFEWLQAIGATSAVLGLALLLAEARQRDEESFYNGHHLSS